MSNFLDKKANIFLEDFLNDYASVDPIDKDYSRKMIKLAIKDYDNAPFQKFLIDNWYQSLKKSDPAFNLYDHKYYFTDLWVCWILYSRKYIKSILKHNSLDEKNSIYNFLKDINNIADLGCGLGLTSVALKQIFPKANVTATNLDNTIQYKFCEQLSKKHNFNIVNHYNKLPDVDLIFASEYFEHIENCLDEVNDIIKQKRPRYFFIANSFNTVSYGHFLTYKNLEDELPIDQTKISKRFNLLLKENGYKKIKTKLWNNKPALWSNINVKYC
jgi:hypothetical protein